MYTVKGSYRNGVATPETYVAGREGENVLITFVDNGLPELSQSGLFKLVEFVARIKALGPEPQAYTPPTGSLADALSDAADESAIDSAAWDRQWASIEAEMKARDWEDDRSEGRG